MNGGLGLVTMVVLVLLVVEVVLLVEVVEVVGVPVARQVMLPGGRPVSLRSGGGRAGKRSNPPQSPASPRTVRLQRRHWQLQCSQCQALSNLNHLTPSSSFPFLDPPFLMLMLLRGLSLCGKVNKPWFVCFPTHRPMPRTFVVQNLNSIPPLLVSAQLGAYTHIILLQPSALPPEVSWVEAAVPPTTAAHPHGSGKASPEAFGGTSEQWKPVTIRDT